MRQKEILGSHFANAWECNKANELIDDGQIRPVLWRTMGFEQVAEAHQLMHENKHLGKIAILVGATEEGQGKHRRGPGRDPRRGRRLMAVAGVVHIPWYATGFRGDRLEAALARDRARGAALRRDDYASTAPGRPLQVPADRRTSRPSATGSATGTARSSPTSASDHSGWYQVPVLYVWNDLVTSGSVVAEHAGRSVAADVPEGDLAG